MITRTQHLLVDTIRHKLSVHVTGCRCSLGCIEWWDVDYCGRWARSVGVCQPVSLSRGRLFLLIRQIAPLRYSHYYIMVAICFRVVHGALRIRLILSQVLYAILSHEFTRVCVSGDNFRYHWHGKINFDKTLLFQKLQVMFVYQGHRGKVKVTRTKLVVLLWLKGHLVWLAFKTGREFHQIWPGVH